MSDLWAQALRSDVMTTWLPEPTTLRLDELVRQGWKCEFEFLPSCPLWKACDGMLEFPTPARLQWKLHRTASRYVDAIEALEGNGLESLNRVLAFLTGQNRPDWMLPALCLPCG